MAPPSKTIRIAVIVDRETAGCLPLILPYSAVGYPLIEIDFFRAEPSPLGEAPIPPWPAGQPEAVTLGLVSEQPPEPVKPLTELRPEAYDLVLDWQNWSLDLPGAPSGGLANLVSGPGTPLLENVLCQYQELRQKHEINADIFLGAADAIITIDENHRIIGYNYGAEKIFGYPREEALGNDLEIIIPPPYKREHKEYVRRYVATREPRVIGKHMQLKAQRRDGSEFPMSISFSVAEVQGNLYFTGIVRDISEYKEMESRLLQSERLAAMGNTVSHIAHEIKNPLAIIGGFARQLIKSPVLEDKDVQKLNIIVEEVSNLESMIAEMRDFVRRPEPRKKPGDLEKLLEETLDLFLDSFQEHHIRVNRIKEDPIPTLTFDHQQLHQVLINLFKNALEAMPLGGELTVATRVKEGNAEISVSDTGEGMSSEVQAKIFQPYFTTKEKGTGLGLAICRNILEEHGGCLLADSAPGQGSTFTIQIPLAEAPPA